MSIDFRAVVYIETVYYHPPYPVETFRTFSSDLELGNLRAFRSAFMDSAEDYCGSKVYAAETVLALLAKSAAHDTLQVRLATAYIKGLIAAYPAIDNTDYCKCFVKVEITWG